ncbi:MAG: hypothetical protein UDG86_05030 [Lachnospiraceae bacterium]|jgi:hypothetical protein|nr:hypothetical protein [Lachnospiraceae bacterium]
MIHMNIEGFATVMAVLGLVIGIIGAFVIFFGFMPKKNEHRFGGWLGKLYDFLNFRFYIIEGLLKFTYVLVASICTGMGLFMSLSIVELTHGLILLVGGNLAARIAYEFILMLIMACRNLGELNKKTPDQSEAQPDGQLPQPIKEEHHFWGALHEAGRSVRQAASKPQEARPQEPRPQEPKPQEPRPQEPVRQEPQTPQPGRVAEQEPASLQEPAPKPAVLEAEKQPEIPKETEDAAWAAARESAVTREPQEAKKPKSGETAPSVSRPAEPKKAAIMKPKHRVCPQCGEKCSTEFAFCNMCGAKLQP